jgi:hypothetical protein
MVLAHIGRHWWVRPAGDNDSHPGGQPGWQQRGDAVLVGATVLVQTVDDQNQPPAACEAHRGGLIELRPHVRIAGGLSEKHRNGLPPQR